MAAMRAVVIREPGGPEVLKVESVPIPVPGAGKVLIHVKAFDQIAEGSLRVPIGRVFHLNEIVEAHRLMDSNEAGGKIVVLT